MKNQYYLLVILFVSTSFFSNAQITKEEHAESFIQLSGLSDQQKLKELVSIHQGTYQLRVSNENYAPVQNLALLESIVNARQQDTNVTFEIDEFTRVFIPSLMTIESETFIPLQTIVYQTGTSSDEVNN